MSELFKTIPISTPPRKLVIIEKISGIIKALSGKCYIDKITSKLPPIKRSCLITKEKPKKNRPRKIFMRPMIIIMI